MKEKFNPFPNTEATLYGDGRRIQIDAAMTPTPLDAKPQGAQLKPCLHCGKSDCVHLAEAKEIYGSNRFSGFSVVCNYLNGGCGSLGPSNDDPSEAVAAWNRRAPDTEAAERIEKLECALAEARRDAERLREVLDEI